MKAGIVLTIAMVGMSTVSARAFEFTLAGFGDAFNKQAEKVGSQLRVQTTKCGADDGGYCDYSLSYGVSLSIHMAAGSSTAMRVAAVAQGSSAAVDLKQAEPIIAALCSPDADDTKRAMYLFALNTAFENDEVASPNVRVIFGGRRYSLKRDPDGRGDVFQVDDNGAWHEEPRTVQPAVVAQAVPAPALSPAPSPSDAEPPTATTADIVAPIAPGDYKVADPEDLHAAPRKFVGKPIEVRNVHCYYADVDDYRCLAPGYSSVAVFATSIDPPTEKAKIEADCGALKVAMTPACQRNLHFVLEDWSEDRPTNMATRTVLKPKSLIIVPIQSGKKRR